MNFDSSVLQVAIEDIIPNRFQPRLSFDDGSLQELSDSIKQHGIIQPLVLRRIGDKYEIIAGERRYKAATMAGLSSVPAVISQIDDKTSAEVAVVENVQRKDLTAIEEAKSYKALLDQGLMSQEQLAKRMGLSQSAISNKLRLLSLAPEIQDAVLDNRISERHARSLLKIKENIEQVKWLNKILNERLTVKQLEDELKKEYQDVSNSPDLDIEKIKSMATDIQSAVSNQIDNQKMSQSPSPLGPIDLGETIAKPKFFNNLEEQAANMSMTEAINPFEYVEKNAGFASASPEPEQTLEPISSINDNSTIESLDTLDFMPQTNNISDSSQVISFPTTKKDISGAINSIDNVVNSLKNEGFIINSRTNDNDTNTIITITIQKEDM